MFTSLYAKTFLILGAQLAVTWLSTMALLRVFRNLFYAKVDWISGGWNQDGEIDLDLEWQSIKVYFWILLLVDCLVFFALVRYGEHNLRLGIPLFTVWSVLTGFELALCLVSVDENLGGRVLGITTLITFSAGLIGAGSGIDFSFLSGALFVSLLLLIVFGLIRIFFSIPRWIQRLGALCGVSVFTGYLLYDFSRLAAKAENGTNNTWEVAMRMSVKIYLDVINLFLDLLDLMSK